MKTTIELPDGLVREVKIRAIHEGRKLKDVVADLLRKGLEASGSAPSRDEGAGITRDPRSGLPLVQCRHPARIGQRLTPERVADILTAQEASWQDDAGR
jgi:plasmid stability protein